MSYVLLSRIVYAMPILIYSALNFQQLMNFPEAYPTMAFWLVMFCFSVFFYCLSKKILPLLLIHFVFFAESYLFTQIAMDTGMYNIFLFIVLSGFYSIESLRNNTLHLLFNVLSLFGVMYYINQLYGITLGDFKFTTETLALLASPVVCLAIMRSMEDRDVVVRETVRNQKVFIPTANEEEEEKLKRKLDFFKTRTKDLKEEAQKAKASEEKIRQDLQRAKAQFEKIHESDQESQRLNKDIAKSYFSLMANIRFDLTKSISENHDNILRVFMDVTKSQYVALIVKEATGNGDEYNLSLLNSYHTGGVNISDDDIVNDDTVYDMLMETLEKDKSNFQIINGSKLQPLKNMIFTPISAHPDVKGVLVQAFDENYKENIHNFNLSLMVAYHIYTILKNENLYKQARDESNIDGLTKVFNKKYLLDNLQLIYNNAYNYSSNLACIFVDVDYFKQVNDSLGHDTGDEVLKFIAHTLSSHVRKSDFVFRYGGDEFVLLMNSVTKEKLEAFGEEVNAALSAKGITVNVGGEQKKLSASMGAVIYNPETANIGSGQELLMLADKAVYTAKGQGKGRLYIGTVE